MASIQIQMNEFQSVTQLLTSKLDLFENSLQEVLGELGNAKTLMGQAVKEFSEGNAGDADQFVEGIEASVLGECEKMRRTMKEICDLEHECKHFQKLETKLRDKFNNKPDEFDMANIDVLVKAKPPSDEHEEHPKYKSFCELIENFKTGNMPEEDLVMEENHDEVIKCPITGKPIVEPIKNSRCDHVYEKDAILAYTKSKTQKRCPFAGCTATVLIPK